MSAADPSGSSPPTKLANGNLRLPLSECRSVVIQLTLLVGNLCQLVLNRVPLDGAAALYVACPEVRRGSAALLQKLLQLSVISGLDLETCIHKKMELNRKKYPVALCKVSLCCRGLLPWSSGPTFYFCVTERCCACFFVCAWVQ
jgi:hypothetical protein